jgi:hypothetical protein
MGKREGKIALTTRGNNLIARTFEDDADSKR